MQSNQQMLIDFFKSSFDDANIRQAFFEDIINNAEVFPQKKASLLAIKSIYEYSWFAQWIAEELVERNHYTLWEHVEFDGDKTIFIQAKDLNAAYRLGFVLCVQSKHIYGGFIYSKNLYDYSYYQHPFHYMIEEKKAQELGIEKSPDGYYYQLGCLLAFQLDKPK